MSYTVRQLRTSEDLDFYELRHSIYCKEFGFEAVNKRSLEFDHYDINAIAYGLFFDGTLIGGFRLILGEFPVQNLVNSLLKPSGEISRFCISKVHRNKQTLSLLARGSTEACLAHGLEFAYALMQKRLVTGLKRIGYQWDQCAHKDEKGRAVYVIRKSSIDQNFSTQPGKTLSETERNPARLYLGS